ncbi:MAG TPA: sugar ABC transporter permease [Candidatus Limnocylindria bacterium]|nr:sugar ABC transporter permease [Candidatus Limnocylindria bacterium]
MRVVFDSLFVQNQAVQVPAFAGLGNYVSLFKDPGFRQVIGNTLVYAVVTVPVSVVLALLLALRLDRPLRAVGLHRLAFFHPTILPMVSAATIWLFMYAPGYGLVNVFLDRIGIGSQNWLGDPQLALPALMVVGLWKQTGYFMLFYLAGLQNLPREVFDAAHIDGASGLRTLRHLTLPLLRGTTLFVTIIAVVDAFQTVDQIYILTGGGPTNATSMLLFAVWQTLFSFLDVGRASAMSVILIAALLVFSIANFASVERRATYE